MSERARYFYASVQPLGGGFEAASAAPELANRGGRPRRVTLICILGDAREVSHVQGPVLSWAHAYTTTLLFARMEVHSKRNVQRVPNP